MARVGIVGARGFVGGELLRLVLGHPGYEVAYVTSESQAGESVAGAFPTLAADAGLEFVSFEPTALARKADLHFMALPDGMAMQHAGALLEGGGRVVDISGDFRVRDRARYEQWYQREHLAPELLARAVYGLPELNSAVSQAHLVANPGCYATTTLLGVAPLFHHGLAAPDRLIVDAKSGVSGAGARAGMGGEFSFPRVHGNLRAYAVVGHRHTAEMEQELEGLLPGGESVTMSFAPHLLPLTRGILATCYVSLRSGASAAELIDLYQEFYAGAPFIRVLAEGLPELSDVVGSNYCAIGLNYDQRANRAIVVSVTDNLIKGAAGQAIQNANLMLGLDETAGLEAAPLGP